MKKDYICHRKSCIYHAPPSEVESCHYALMTGKCKLPLMDPQHRDPKHCPVYRPGIKIRSRVRPLVVNGSLDNQSRQKYSHQRMMELYRAGWNDYAIGRQLGCSPSTIHVWRKRNRLPANTAPGGQRKEKAIDSQGDQM